MNKFSPEMNAANKIVEFEDIGPILAFKLSFSKYFKCKEIKVYVILMEHLF